MDRSSLTFGRTGDEASLLTIWGHPLCHHQRVDDDGTRDLVCLFRARPADFDGTSTTGVPKGADVDGSPFSGSDSVRPLPWL